MNRARRAFLVVPFLVAVAPAGATRLAPRGPTAPTFAGSCGAGSFSAPATTPISPEPVGLASGDFDGDGDLDVAVANRTPAGAVTVLLGDGAGGLAPGQVLAGDEMAISVAAADMNRDGRLDLLVSRYTVPGAVAVHLGNGDGTFGPPIVQDVVGFPGGLAVADLNRDGWPDVATPILYNNVLVMLGDGAGGFSSVSSVKIPGADPSHAVPADLDGDGRLDLVVGLETVARIAVLRGHGDGTFDAPAFYAAAPNPGRVAVGDFDRDGDLDVATANGLSGDSVSVLLGDGAGHLGPATTIRAGYDVVDVVAGDFGGDGRLDLAAKDNNGTLFLFKGDGAGRFAAPVRIPAGGRDGGLLALDIDADGRPDLVTSNFYEGTVSVLLNACPRCPSEFAPARTLSGASLPFVPLVADFDRDGRLDLLVSNSGAASLGLYRGDGAGNFSAPAVVPVGHAGPLGLVSADFDRDGAPDLAVSYGLGGSGITVLLNDGAGGFGPPADYATGAAAYGMAADDFDRDGDVDLAVANRNSNTITVLFGDGTGAFAPAQTLATRFENGDLEAADFDRDGDVDLAVANGFPSSVSVFYNDGAGAFGGRSDVDVGSKFIEGFGVGDFDRDGDLDLVVPANTSGGFFLANDGTGHFSFQSFFPYDPGNDVFVADVNADGALDLVNGSFFLQGASVAYGTGTGAFGPQVFLPTGGSAFAAVAADLDGNGLPDLVAPNFDGTTVAVFLQTALCGPKFGACVVGDGTGDAFRIVTDRASPDYGSWEYRVAATGEVFAGVASSLAYIPGRSLVAADADDPRVAMSANLNYAANTGTVTVTDRATGRRFVLRDRSLRDDPPCP